MIYYSLKTKFKHNVIHHSFFSLNYYNLHYAAEYFRLCHNFTPQLLFVQCAKQVTTAQISILAIFFNQGLWFSFFFFLHVLDLKWLIFSKLPHIQNELQIFSKEKIGKIVHRFSVAICANLACKKIAAQTTHCFFISLQCK